VEKSRPRNRATLMSLRAGYVSRTGELTHGLSFHALKYVATKYESSAKGGSRHAAFCSVSSPFLWCVRPRLSSGGLSAYISPL